MMSVATLRSEPAQLAIPQTHGAASVAFACDNGTTRLTGLYQRHPLRVLFPEVPADEIPTAVLVTTSGGLVGGDRLDVSVAIGDGAEAMVFGQAAEKVYRSLGPTSRIAIGLSVARDGWLEWLPQETILFEGARLERRTRIEVAPGARALAGEILVFGRIACGEQLSRGLVHDAWEVRRGGRLQWTDALHLEDEMAGVLADPACFDGATAYATIVHAGDVPADHLDLARSLLGKDSVGLRAGATVVNGVLVVRWLGRDAEGLRRAFGDFWAAFRAAAGGRRSALPRLWHV
jgi:urease accessory protein